MTWRQKIRHRTALMLRRMAYRIDAGPIEQLGQQIDEILPDDFVVWFRGVDPENPINVIPSGWTEADDSGQIVYRVAGD